MQLSEMPPRLKRCRVEGVVMVESVKALSDRE